jgi:hypothetical protein
MTVNQKVQRPTRVEKIVRVFSSPNEINQELPPTNQNGGGERRIRKKCLGCGNNFIGPPSENSDYCRNCEKNRKRYILKVHEQSTRVPQKLHPLTGIITHQEPYKVYHKDSPYQGNQCYKLQVVLEQNPEHNEKEPAKLFVYPNLVPPPIYQTIQESRYIDQRYLLFCTKKVKG